MKPGRLITVWCLSIVMLTSNTVFSAETPFNRPIDAKEFKGKILSPSQVQVLLGLQLDSLPYQLAQYARTGNDLALHSIREASYAVDRYIRQLGESIGNNREKETYAKLNVGFKNLTQNIDKTVAAAREYRRARTVFDYRAERLIEWLDIQIIELIRSSPDCPEPDEPGLLNGLRLIRLELLGCPTGIWLPLGDAGTQELREKAVEHLNTARSIASNVISSSSEDTEKQFAWDVSQSVDVLTGSTQDLFLRSDELRQAWDDTVAAVGSMKAVLTVPPGKKRPAEDTKTTAPSSKE